MEADGELGKRLKETRESVKQLSDVLPEPMFTDMKGLLGRLQGLMKTLTS